MWSTGAAAAGSSRLPIVRSTVAGLESLAYASGEPQRAQKLRITPGEEA
jgi:hypothetical protein